MSNLTDDQTALKNSQPPYLYPDYGSTRKRAPSKPLIALAGSLANLHSPVFGHNSVKPEDGDLTKQHSGEPLGERILVTGTVLSDDGHPVRGALIEIWQANAAGRYKHKNDNHA